MPDDKRLYTRYFVNTQVALVPIARGLEKASPAVTWFAAQGHEDLLSDLDAVNRESWSLLRHFEHQESVGARATFLTSRRLDLLTRLVIGPRNLDALVAAESLSANGLRCNPADPVRPGEMFALCLPMPGQPDLIFTYLECVWSRQAAEGWWMGGEFMEIHPVDRQRIEAILARGRFEVESAVRQGV